MENIHKLDSETVESLSNMFNSGDDENIRIALTILNNIDFSDNNIAEFINELYYNCSGLFFALFQNKKGNIRARFTYINVGSNKRTYMIDDESSIDDNEWIPYEPHNDPDSQTIFNYK